MNTGHLIREQRLFAMVTHRIRVGSYRLGSVWPSTTTRIIWWRIRHMGCYWQIRFGGGDAAYYDIDAVVWWSGCPTTSGRL